MNAGLSKKQAPSPVLLGGHDASYVVAASPSPGAPAPLTLALDVRRAALSVSTIASVAVILLLTLLFHHGMQLSTYDGAMATQDRDALLDKYNGYTGNVATAVTRPLEIVVATLSQFFILRFLAKSLLRPEPTWTIGLVAMGVSAALGFLLNSGFNALNVQLRNLDVEPFMDASDLVAPSVDAAKNQSAVTNVTNSFSERQANNPITNTVLRNLLLPRPEKAPAQCTFSLQSSTRPADDSIDFWLPQREWMNQLLPTAPDAATLRVVLNATDAAANKDVKPSALPMNASVAADLFVATALLSNDYIPWGKLGLWNDKLPSDLAAGLGEKETLPTGIAAGLLPASRDAPELDQRDWFLRAVQTFFNGRTLNTENMTRSDVRLEFAHVDLSPEMTFDSLTLEVDADPALYTELGGNGTQRTRYANVDCRMFPGVYSFPRYPIDVRPVVHVYAACANDDGSETLHSLPRGTAAAKSSYDFFVQCPRRSNSSLLVLSAGKRLEADTILEDTVALTKQLNVSAGSCVAVNLRKTYEFTVGRVAWQPHDLAQKFNAQCNAPGGCMGLDMPLADGRRLVLGADALSFNSLSTLEYAAKYNERSLHPLPLVAVKEPARVNQSWEGPSTYGDYLFAHNVRNATTKLPRTRTSGESCTMNAEDRQQLVLNNHMYIESTRQTSYTAALFFLFQNAVVRESVAMRNGTTTLAFNGNQQRLGLWVSIPTANTLQTCAGCVLLVAAWAASLFWSHRKARSASDPMQAITTPEVIARVMLDGRAFPPSVVQRRVVVDSAGYAAGSEVDGYYIESLTLKPRDGGSNHATVQV